MAHNSYQENFAYRTLADALRAKIQSGYFGVGAQLPTEVELVEQHGVSRQTVRRAMQELVAADLVYRVRGRGTFVSDSDRQLLRPFGSVETLLRLSGDTSIEVLDPLHRNVDLEAAGRLHLETDVVYVLTYRRLYRDTPVSFTKVYLAPDVAEQLSDVAELHRAGGTTSGASTVIGLIEEHAGIPIMSADQSITVGFLPVDGAAAIHCDAEAPMLRVDRLYCDASGRPVELAISWWNPNLFTYRVRLERR